MGEDIGAVKEMLRGEPRAPTEFGYRIQGREVEKIKDQIWVSMSSSQSAMVHGLT